MILQPKKIIKKLIIVLKHIVYNYIIHAFIIENLV